jgi:hypothetical protein
LQSQGAGFLLLEGEFAFQPAKLSILSWSDGRIDELLLSKNENLAPFCGKKDVRKSPFACLLSCFQKNDIFRPRQKVTNWKNSLGT